MTTQKFTFMTKDGQSFEREVNPVEGRSSFPDKLTISSSEDIVFAQDHESEIKDYAYALFSERVRSEALKIAEGLNRLESVIGIMWQKTKLKEREQAIMDTKSILSHMRPRAHEFVRYTDKGHTVYIEVGTVFVPLEKAGNLPLNKPVTEPKNEDFFFRTSEYTGGGVKGWITAPKPAEQKAPGGLQVKTYGAKQAERTARWVSVLELEDKLIAEEAAAFKTAYSAISENIAKDLQRAADNYIAKHGPGSTQ